MPNKVSITPSELVTQSNRLANLSNQLDEITLKANKSLSLIEHALSSKFSSNMGNKGKTLLKNLNSLKSSLMIGSNVAKKSAGTFETVDRQLAKLYKEDVSSRQGTTAKMDSVSTKPVDMNYYMQNVTDAEYAKLCLIWYGVDKKGGSVELFLDRIKDELPQNDPLATLTYDQVRVVKKGSGLSAVVITDAAGNAIVIFNGTDVFGDAGDDITDLKLAVGQGSKQSSQANELIFELAQNGYHNVVVTGHSLGGYLATSTALHNGNVSKCVAFDPPGRYDAKEWNRYPETKSRITTYEAIGSTVSGVGGAIGNKVPLNVKPNGKTIFDKNHGLSEIYDELGGKKKMTKSWNATMGGR